MAQALADGIFPNFDATETQDVDMNEIAQLMQMEGVEESDFRNFDQVNAVDMEKERIKFEDEKKVFRRDKKNKPTKAIEQAQPPPEMADGILD